EQAVLPKQIRQRESANPAAGLEEKLATVPEIFIASMRHYSPHIQKLVQVQDDVRERFERSFLDQVHADGNLGFGRRSGQRNAIGEVNLRVRVGRFAADALRQPLGLRKDERIVQERERLRRH